MNNAYQFFADFRYEKSTQVNEHHGLSPEEANKIDQDGEEDGWINIGEAQCLHHLIKEAIDAKLCIERYAKSKAIKASAKQLLLYLKMQKTIRYYTD